MVIIGQTFPHGVGRISFLMVWTGAAVLWLMVGRGADLATLQIFPRITGSVVHDFRDGVVVIGRVPISVRINFTHESVPFFPVGHAHLPKAKNPVVVEACPIPWVGGITVKRGVSDVVVVRS